MKRYLFALLLLVPALTFAATCPSLSRNLSRGASGDDVKQLQQFLISQNDLENGFDTGFYGPKTEAAVQKFQCDQKLICEGTAADTGWGSVGPKTRSTITSVCGGTSNRSSAPSTSLTAPFGLYTCEFGGKTIGNRAVVRAYKSQSVPLGSSCESEVRTCSNGTLTGSYTSSFCFVELGKSCTLDNFTVLNGQYQTFYSIQAAQSSASCSDNAQLRECSDGTLTGSSAYKYISCSTYIAPATSTPSLAPSGLHATCDSSGTKVLLSWNPVSSAQTYGLRVLPSGSSQMSLQLDWYTGSTTYMASTTPSTNYSWWVYANTAPLTLGAYTIGDPFTCRSQ